MINLLPPKVKKSLVLDKVTNFVSIGLIFLAINLFILILFSLPVSTMQSYQFNSIREDKQFTVEVEQQRKDREADNLAIQKLIQYIEGGSKSVSYWTLIKKFDALAGEGIDLEKFDFSSKNEITINGISSTRTDLSNFRDSLEADSQFKSVELPLASLATEKNTPFTIKLKLN